MKTIKRSETEERVVWLIRKNGYACPRCKKEAWATGKHEIIKNGWCTSCAYKLEDGEDVLKIIDD